MAALGGRVAGILGNSTLEQIALWQIGGSLIGAVLSPYLQAATHEVNRLTPITPLSPADAAQAVIRNAWSADKAADEALFWGIGRERFDVLVRLAGQAPGPLDLAVALRRKLIDEARYLEGIRQGNLRDEWAETVKALAVQQPSPTAMLQAYLEGQVSEGEAREKYAALGGDPAYFDILYNSQGSAPTPLEAAEMARRGVIPWDGEGAGVVSYRQAFLEGPWRNKWEQPYRVLSQYLPPPRTITAMYREGSLTHDDAAQLLAQQGVPPVLITAYLTSGSSQKTASGKDLGQAAILTLYRDKIVTHDQAAAMLQGLKYDASEAGYLLSIADLEVAQRFLSSAVARVHALYVGHKITQPTVTSTLGKLGLDSANVAQLVSIWSFEREANVRALTPTDYRTAFAKGLLDQATAQAELEALGFTPHDAWLYLSLHAGKNLPNEPPAGASA